MAGPEGRYHKAYDKCRHCGQSGHFARDCPNPWGANQGSAADSAPSVVNSALDPGTAVSTPSVVSTNNETPTSGVLGRMARRLFSRASSTPARDDVAVPSTSKFGPESSPVVASPSGEAPSGASEVASGSSSPSVSQSLVSLNSQSILQDAQVIATDSMDVEVANGVPVCDVTPDQCNSGKSSAINNVISTTENESNVVGSNKSAESNELNVPNIVNVSNQSNELMNQMNLEGHVSTPFCPSIEMARSRGKGANRKGGMLPSISENNAEEEDNAVDVSVNNASGEKSVVNTNVSDQPVPKRIWLNNLLFLLCHLRVPRPCPPVSNLLVQYHHLALWKCFLVLLLRLLWVQVRLVLTSLFLFLLVLKFLGHFSLWLKLALVSNVPLQIVGP